MTLRSGAENTLARKPKGKGEPMNIVDNVENDSQSNHEVGCSGEGSTPEALSFDELWEMFKHYDGVAAHKETLFIPITFASVVAVLLTWDKEVPTSVVLVLGIASVLLYFYHVVVIEGFGRIQDELYERMDVLRKDFKTITCQPRDPQQHQERTGLGTRILRERLVFFLLLFWLVILLAHAVSHRGNLY